MSTTPSRQLSPALFGGDDVDQLVAPVLADGSHERGVYLVSQLAQAWGVPVRLVHVCHPQDEPALRAGFVKRVEQAATNVSNAHPNVRIDGVVVDNASIGAGVHAAASENALICLATDKISEVLEPASVGEQVAAAVETAVLLFGPHCKNLNLDGSVVVALDGSERAETSIPYAVAFAEALGTNVWLVNVIGPQFTALLAELREKGETVSESAYLRSVAAQYVDASVSVEWEVLHGTDPIERISGFAMTHESSVIVVTTHKSTQLTRGVFDSVSMGLAEDSPSPVLVVKSDATTRFLTQ